MNRRFVALIAFLLLAALARAAEGPRFKLTVPRPMHAGTGGRLEPGEYEVTFEPAPAGPPRYTAVFSRRGVRIATAPALLKNAPAGFKLSQVATGDWIQASWKAYDARKDGSIHAANFDFQVKSERAFFEALLTEIGMPALDGSSKAPQTTGGGVAPPRVTPPARLLPSPEPTPKT